VLQHRFPEASLVAEAAATIKTGKQQRAPCAASRCFKQHGAFQEERERKERTKMIYPTIF
jgi:hypothetical protein